MHRCIILLFVKYLNRRATLHACSDVAMPVCYRSVPAHKRSRLRTNRERVFCASLLQFALGVGSIRLHTIVPTCQQPDSQGRACAGFHSPKPPDRMESSEPTILTPHKASTTWRNSIYQAQGKYEQAKPLHQRAFLIYEQQLGANHPSTHFITRNYETLKRTRVREKKRRSWMRVFGLFSH